MIPSLVLIIRAPLLSAETYGPPLLAALLAVAAWFLRDIKRAGGLRSLHAILLAGKPLPGPRERPPPGFIQRGWTEREWASRDYGVTVTGAPRWAGPAALPLPESAPEALRDTTGTAYGDWPTGGFRAADAALAKGELA